MSTLLSAQSISYDVTSGPLLEEISFTLNKGDRIGLIGHNGCGKSTLLKLLSNKLTNYSGQITRANHCLIERVEQYLPDELAAVSLLNAVAARLPQSQRAAKLWRAELLLSDMGFSTQDRALTAGTLSGGQHTRLLLARALIKQPDVLLLDEPSNHMDLPTLLWLENFLRSWHGSFVLVSHDQRLLDNVTNCTWIMRDRSLQFFRLPCSLARQALAEKDRTDEQRHQSEQKEIDRIEKSAKRLAIWGKIHDNEDLARKAKHMEKRAERLKENQTQLSAGTPWRLSLKGEALPANRLLEVNGLDVRPEPGAPVLFHVLAKQLKSGDRVAIIGRNGTGKSSLLRMLWQAGQQLAGSCRNGDIVFHPRGRLGYYDQSQQQLCDGDTLLEALYHYAPLPDEQRKMALISAGFPYLRHSQKVAELSGGERARLLFVGLTLASYHLLLLDEPTNHLDLEGKEELAETLGQFAGGFILVSHDRELIEKSCNRFWLVDDRQLEEWHDIEQVYDRLAGSPGRQEASIDTEKKTSSKAGVAAQEDDSDQEQLLARLIELETLLEEDQARKPKHQKPRLQQGWQAEINRLNTLLEIG